MRRSPSLFLALAAAAGTVVLAACADTTTSPTNRLSPNGPAFTLGSTANVGPVQVTFASSSTTQYCATGGYPAIHTYTVPSSLGPLTGCGTAFDLTTNLTTSYNPGWDAPITGSAWIGPTATANEYRPTPGGYVFQTQFDMPAGVTSPVLNDTLMSDNAVAVYLNGHQIEAQVIADCDHAADALCNWESTNMYVISDANAADFNIGGTNTITVLLVDTPNGGTPTNSYDCTTFYQPDGRLGYSGTFNVPTYPDHVVSGWTQDAATSCENPTGLDFSGGVSWVVPPPPSTTWCSPGFWKNHEDLWTAYWGVLYSSLTDAAPLSKKAPAGDPTIKTVVENPSIYGGPATNSVADFLSNKFFGTPIGAGVESCPDPSTFASLGN